MHEQNSRSKPKNYIRTLRQEKRQFSVEAPLQLTTEDNRIPIKLAGADYMALLDTGSDLCTIPDKYQKETLLTLCDRRNWP